MKKLVIIAASALMAAGLSVGTADATVATKPAKNLGTTTAIAYINSNCWAQIDYDRYRYTWSALRLNVSGCGGGNLYVINNTGKTVYTSPWKSAGNWSWGGGTAVWPGFIGLSTGDGRGTSARVD